MPSKKRTLKLKDNSEIPKEDHLHQFNEKLRLRSFDPDTCFLCATSLTEVETSSEHVIPRWAQKRYDLWNQEFVLLNRTTIPYRQLTVPCCADCNKYQLQPIETSISQAVLQGPEAVRKLGDNILFLWLGKIFYGLLYRELFLLLDIKEKNEDTIASPDMVAAYETLLFFLQQARGKVQIVDFCPGSIFVFETQKPKPMGLQWDFCDSTDTMFIAIRMGNVGIIGVLGDGGAQMQYASAYKNIMDLQLHPIQFRELCAHFAYRATLATRTPKYIIVQDIPHKVIQMPLGGLSSKPFFEDWELPVYSKFLSYYTGCPQEHCFDPPNKVLTFLYDELGRPNYLDFKKYPFLPESLYT